MSDPSDAIAIIEQFTQAQGFALTGIAQATPSQYQSHYADWIDQGKHGEMAYLQAHQDIRQDPTRLLEEACSVICVADIYADEAAYDPQAGQCEMASPIGRLARYGWGRDYHKTIKKRLHQLADALQEQYPEHAFRCTVDTAPLLEREYATRAGMGWIGKHTLLIHRELGSWLLLGAIVTTLPLSTDEPAPLMKDPCGTCTRCIDACPTDAILTTDQKRELDATRCISYLTLEHRSLIDPALHEGMQDWLGGCDICQEVCPFNGKILSLPIHPDYAPREHHQGLSLLEVLDWTEEDRQRVLQGSAFMRMKLPMLKRNALIVAGNWLKTHDDLALQKKIHALADAINENVLIQETARQVLGQITQG